ncbi:GerAB/ArcD/ProY family transporter [Sporosarcina thermotolerans]|uniref:GerAB/ArcD/ProY family transporter n=1 Tax=Sporosarcina thermotolerans TaxID=633404 RepID=A0AAW9A726_9BACL|nr:GerAB/ArcD/ProY family transporter [Sporosarcina thermotolerans]MDW0115431.1 GerAB/ArcD/ProY family transporter [Sporosarcina thermotolerans]WHT47241.1 GerAB/ArcD/ProY family transporter [Sporosarcina thermotolerans]
MFTLSRIQFFLLLFVVQTGTVFVSFQHRLINIAGTTSWVVFIAAGLMHYVLLLLYEKFYKRFKPGRFVAGLYIAYWSFAIIAFLSYVNYTLSVWIFPNTPQIVTMAIIVGVSLYANTRRIEAVINLPSIILALFPIFIVFLFMAIPDLVWTWLFPVKLTEIKPLLRGLFMAQATFIGIEFYLFFRKYVIQKVKGMPLFIYQLTWFFFFFTILVFILLFFPVHAITFIPEPLLHILKAQKVTFVERLDLFFLFIWVIWSVIAITLYFFMCVQARRIYFNNENKFYTVLLHCLIIIVSSYFATKDRSDMLRQLIVYPHILFTILIPAVVILLNRGNKN